VTALGATGVAAADGTTAETIDDDLDTTTDTPQDAIVVFESRPDVDRLRHLDLADGYYKYKAMPFGYTRLTGTQVETVADWPEVRRVEANREHEHKNVHDRDQSGATVVREELFYTGESVHAVVIDGGVDGDHPDLKNNLEANYRFVDPLSNDPDEQIWVDLGERNTGQDGHGTHVSGTVAADGTQSDRRFRGLAPDASVSVYSCQVGLPLLQLTAAYDDMVDKQRQGIHDVQVANNSYGPFGGDQSDFDPFGSLQLATWVAFQEGILSSFSMGNSGSRTNTMTPYGKAPFNLASAATDQNGAVTDFSSRGRTPDYGGPTNYDRQEALENFTDLLEKSYTDQPKIGEGTFSGVVGATASEYHKWEPESTAGYVSATLSWSPNEDVDFYLHEGSRDGRIVASGASLQNPEELATQIDGDKTYWFEVRPFANVTASYRIEYTSREDLDEPPMPPYGIYRPTVGNDGDFKMSTFAPNDPLNATSVDDEVYYGRISGTSMSSPGLIGCAALVFDAYKQNFGAFPEPVEVLKLIEATARSSRESHNAYNIGAGYTTVVEAVRRAEDGNLAAFDEVDVATGGEVTESLFYADGSREGDADAYTAGQSARTTITVEVAESGAIVRDRIPFGWNLEDSDPAITYTENGDRYIEFPGPVSEGDSVTYFLEAPGDTTDAGDYQFGPAEAAPADGVLGFQEIAGVDTNSVVTEDSEL